MKCTRPFTTDTIGFCYHLSAEGNCNYKGDCAWKQK